VQTKIRIARGLGLGAAAALLSLAIASGARAGTYTIYDCPSYNSNSAGPWQIGGGSSQKTTCSRGLGDFIGALGGEMGAGSEWAMSVTAPQGETLTYYSIYWYVAGKSSGGDVFSEVWSSGGSELENGENTLNARYTPEAHTLPTGTTSFVLAVYCSTDDYSDPCKYSEPETPAIAMFGSAIVVSDPTAPTGGLTGGGLDGNGPASGTQSISYTANDSLAGVYSVQLLVDGEVVATNSYAGSCSFTDFQPCPASEPGSVSWDTADVPNGAHEIELLITNAAGDTTIVGDHAITTSNSPSFVSPPAISGSPAVGQTLRSKPGQVSSDPAAGSLKTSGRWLRCDASGDSCAAIANATEVSYSVSSEDLGHTLRYQETATNNDGSNAAESEAFGPIQAPGETKEAREAREAREAEEAKGSNGSNGSNGANGAAGAGGVGGSATVDVLGSGVNQGLVALGSTAKWRVSLRVSPDRVRQHTKVKLTGLVLTSPRPSQGKLVFLQARSVGSRWQGHGRTRHRVAVFGKWLTFQEFRAKANGTFSSTYRFRLGGRHTYQFQAVAPAEGQYRNPTGISLPVLVTEI
jgi:hypothetical protein